MLTFIKSLLAQVTTQGLTAAAALAAAILGPSAAIFIGRLQVRASIRSVNRHAWITALREDVCEVMEKRIELSQLVGFNGTTKKLSFSDPTKADELIQRIRFLGYRIELRLHPDEPDHDSLIKLLEQAPSSPKNAELNAAIKKSTQKILREEWKRAAKAK